MNNVEDYICVYFKALLVSSWYAVDVRVRNQKDPAKGKGDKIFHIPLIFPTHT